MHVVTSLLHYSRTQQRSKVTVSSWSSCSCLKCDVSGTARVLHHRTPKVHQHHPSIMYDVRAPAQSGLIYRFLCVTVGNQSLITFNKQKCCCDLKWLITAATCFNKVLQSFDQSSEIRFLFFTSHLFCSEGSFCSQTCLHLPNTVC